jgi:hypothetical protein
LYGAHVGACTRISRSTAAFDTVTSVPAAAVAACVPDGTVPTSDATPPEPSVASSRVCM